MSLKSGLCIHPKFSNKGLYKIYEMSGSITKVQLMPNGQKVAIKSRR